MKFCLAYILFSPILVWAAESTCHGTTSNGHLENGVQLPRSGPNFVTYSDVARTAGRTYVHSEVKEIILAAYKSLEQEQPSKVYKYAETGFKNGGQFKPHKTHRNGLSVDFMTPMMNKKGESVHLPTYPWNRFGYDISAHGWRSLADEVHLHGACQSGWRGLGASEVCGSGLLLTAMERTAMRH